MSYRNQLQLSFSPTSFHIENSTKKLSTDNQTPITLSAQSTVSSQLSPIALLVLKSLQHRLATIKQSTIAPKQLLRFVSEAWSTMLSLEEEARMLEFCGVTKLKLLETDDKLSLRARCTLLESVPASAKSKESSQQAGFKRVDVDFAVKAIVSQDETAGEIGRMDFETDVIASKVYGFGTGNTGPSENEMQSILRDGLGEKQSGLGLGNGVWSKAVQALTGTVF